MWRAPLVPVTSELVISLPIVLGHRGNHWLQTSPGRSLCHNGILSHHSHFSGQTKVGDFTNHVIRASAHGRQNCTPVTNVLIEKLIREDKLKSKSTASGYQKASQPKDYKKLIQTWIGKLQKALQALPSSLWENLLKSKLRAVKKPRLWSWSTVWSPPQPTPKRSYPDLVFFLQLKETIFWGNILGLADLSWWSMFCLALAQYSWCQEVAPLFWQLRHSRFTESRARCASS